MPGDPYKVFREASNQKREALKAFWAELYGVLMAAAVEHNSRPIKCPMCATRYPNEPAPIAGRLTRNGHPACRRCLDELADPPQGWPLRLLEPGENP